MPAADPVLLSQLMSRLPRASFRADCCLLNLEGIREQYLAALCAFCGNQQDSSGNLQKTTFECPTRVTFLFDVCF
jgi:hypothetical protein